MLIIGYSFGIRSERRLCEEVHLNLAYRWFCQLGLEDAVPDHSTFSKNRHGRFRESGAFRCGAADEFTLAATVQNLRRMVKLLAHGPPINRIGAPA